MHCRVETPQGSMHRGVTKVVPLKNPKWSYAPGSRDCPLSYAPGSQDSQTKFLQIQDNYVTYNLLKFQIDSIKIKA